MLKFEKPDYKVKEYVESDNYGKFEIEPLERGFGTTLGNALRRVMLSSLPGDAITSVKIEGVAHEFQKIDGVIEDVTAIVLNLKSVVIKNHSENYDYILTASKKFLNENDNILIIDDFLANGEAVLGTSRILSMANCNVKGVGIVIEKAFQPGHDKLVNSGFDVYSLARVSKLGKDLIEFVD